MSNLSISIIVPIYNIEKYLDYCLKSVILTDKRVVEILCIDDGSKDRSRDIVEKYKSVDTRIKYIYKINGGISSARNRGIKEAKGKYILFIDGDDYIIPEIFNELLNKLDRLDNFDSTWCGYFRDDWNGIHNVNTNLLLGNVKKDYIMNTFIPSFLGISYKKLYAWLRKEQSLNEKQEFSTVWRGLYKTKIIKENNIKFNENVKTGEDVLFNLEFYYYANSIYISNDNYYCYRLRQGSLTQNSKEFFLESK